MKSQTTRLAQGGHVELVYTPGLPTVAIFVDADRQFAAVDLTRAEAEALALLLLRFSADA